MCEDTYLDRMPYAITHALMGDLAPSDRWKELFMAVESSRELQDASAVDVQKSASFSRVHLFDPISEHATFRMRREEAQPDTHSPLPSEDHTPFKGQAGQYHQHHLVGSETLRQRETAASGGGGGSSPKEEGEWRVACCLGP